MSDIFKFIFFNNFLFVQLSKYQAINYINIITYLTDTASILHVYTENKLEISLIYILPRFLHIMLGLWSMSS